MSKKNKGRQGKLAQEKKEPMQKAVAKTASARKGARLSPMGRIVLIVLIACLLLGGGIGGFFIYRAHAGYNYIEADLSRYVSLSPEDLKNITLVVKVDKPTEEDVERELLSLRVQHKTLVGGSADDLIAEGSAVSLYYAGYILGSNGGKEYFSGGSNLLSAAKGSPMLLTIGSGSFAAGFEEGLIGIRPSETEIPTVITQGTLAEGDTIYVNMRGYHPNGAALNLSGQPLVLSPDLDLLYGEGFYELLLGKTIGERIIKNNTMLKNADGSGGEFLYTSLSAEFKTVGGKAHTVEAYFPMDYQEGSPLCGKTAYFEVYIKDTTSYDLPALTDAFLTEKVGIVAAELEDYEGDTLVEKYKAFLRQKFAEDYETRLFSASEESFWLEIVKVASTKRVPRAAVNEVYDEYMESLRLTYEDYLDSMGVTKSQYPFKTFTKEYFTLNEGESYKSRVKAIAERTAREKMIFFYAIRVMGVAPTEAELETEFFESLRTLAKQNSLLDESYYEDQTDPEKREAAYKEYMKELSKTENMLLEAAGEEYFLESAYYNLGFPRLLEKAKVTYVGKGHS